MQGPDTEVEGKLVTADFLALLDDREREIVLLNSGFTSPTDIAHELGHANHSAISKKLAKIRKQAQQSFGLN